MSTLLTDNLPLLSGAPNGIPKLRELILELAVRGKLVRQNHAESAIEKLLDDSRKERADAMASGLIKKEKPAAPIKEDEQPFSLPSGWAWCRIVDTGDYINGLALRPTDWSNSGRPIIRIQNLSGRNAEFNRTKVDVDPSVIVNAGDILVSWSATLDAYIWQGEQGVLNQHIFRVSPSGVVNTQYLYWLLKWAIRVLANSDHAHGLVMAHINRGPFLAQPVGLPPLEEQQRIVAKIEELMAWCDALEVEQSDAANAHTGLVQALLGSLTATANTQDFSTSWQRVAEHFHTLFTTESSIYALKQTLLQLAVMGKLVPQDSTDEPASELLARVQYEKQAVVATGRIKSDKMVPSKKDDKKPFQLPPAWSWTRLGDICVLGPSNGFSPKPALVETPYRCLTLSATTRGLFKGDCFKFVDIEEAVAKKYWLKKGDLLIQRANSIDYVGVSAIYNGEDDQYIYPDLMMRINISRHLSTPYVHAYLSSIEGRGYFRSNATGTQGNMPKINQGTVVNAPIPIPPINEQHRIIAKVDEITRLCDQLRTRLVQGNQLNEQLAVALVERALMKSDNVTDAIIDPENARILLAAEIVQKLHCEKRMGRVKLQKVISLAEHVARLKEIQSKEERYAAGPHDPALMTQAVQGLRENQWFEELALDDGKRYEYRPLAQSGTHRPTYEALWSTEQRRQINELIELMRPWDTARCERVATLYSAWNDLLIEGRDANEAGILQEVLHGWNDSKLKYTETQWRAELVEMQQHSFLIPTGFGNRTSGGKLTLPGFEPSIKTIKT